MHPMLNIAVRAARAGGSLIARHIGSADRLQVESKHPDDLVTNIDRECEQTVRAVLQKAYRSHAVLGEEGGLTGSPDAEYRWYIDPIDGTTNFIRGLPQVTVSIGLHHRGRPLAGVVFSPLTNELFTAARGEGAALNGRRIRVGDRDTLEGSLIATAPPARYRERMPAYLQLFARLVDQVADIRRSGCASLDLCYVACGRYDGYLEQGLKAWDFAAGEVVLREAGGIITDFMGDNHYTRSGNLLCGNPRMVQELLTRVCDPPTLAAELR